MIPDILDVITENVPLQERINKLIAKLDINTLELFFKYIDNDFEPESEYNSSDNQYDDKAYFTDESDNDDISNIIELQDTEK